MDEAHRCQLPLFREILDDGDIELLKIHTTKNLANMLTKVVLGVKFTHCKALLHILSID